MVALLIDGFDRRRSSLDRLVNHHDPSYSFSHSNANSFLRHRKRFRSIDVDMLNKRSRIEYRCSEDDSFTSMSDGEETFALFVEPSPSRSTPTHTSNMTPTSPTTTFQQQHFPRNQYLISPEHPFKITWDVLTLILSLVNAYLTHIAIRDRSYGWNFYKFLTELWFVADVLLNFITEHRLDHRRRLVTFQSVSARYLTTWFWIDVLSLLPGETLFVQPVLQRLQRRRFKIFRRLGRIVVWTRKLLGNGDFRKFTRHVTKQQGFRATTRTARFFIRYIPKYWIFLRNMKAVVGLRILRQVHWVHKLTRRLVLDTSDLADGCSNTEDTDWVHVRPLDESYDDDGAPF